MYYDSKKNRKKLIHIEGVKTAVKILFRLQKRKTWTVLK